MTDAGEDPNEAVIAMVVAMWLRNAGARTDDHLPTGFVRHPDGSTEEIEREAWYVLMGIELEAEGLVDESRRNYGTALPRR